MRNALDHVEEQQALLQKLSMDEEQSLEKIAEMEEQLREVEESFELFEQQVATQQSQEFVEALGSQMEEYTVLYVMNSCVLVHDTCSPARVRECGDLFLWAGDMSRSANSRPTRRPSLCFRNWKGSAERTSSLLRQRILQNVCPRCGRCLMLFVVFLMLLELLWTAAVSCFCCVLFLLSCVVLMVDI